MEPELDRIRREYERRAQDPRYADLYSASDPSNALAVRSREQATTDLFAAHAPRLLADADVVDLGCGSGGELLRLIGRGVDPARCIGIDLLPARVEAASGVLPGGVRLCVANAGVLPLRENSFDLVLLFTVLSSVLDARLRRRIASEVTMVLRPGGAVLWYDFRWNPTNGQTTGIGPREIRRLFPNFEHHTRSVTLAPPLARAVAPRSLGMARALERVPLLRSHTIGLAVKPVEPS